MGGKRFHEKCLLNNKMFDYLIWSWDLCGSLCHFIIKCWMVKVMVGLKRTLWVVGRFFHKRIVEQNHDLPSSGYCYSHSRSCEIGMNIFRVLIVL